MGDEISSTALLAPRAVAAALLSLDGPDLTADETREILRYIIKADEFSERLTEVLYHRKGYAAVGKTWEEFAAENLDKPKTTAWRIVNASLVRQKLVSGCGTAFYRDKVGKKLQELIPGAIGDSPIPSAHCLQLYRLPEEQWVPAWQEACLTVKHIDHRGKDSNEQGKVTERYLKTVVEQRLAQLPPASRSPFTKQPRRERISAPPAPGSAPPSPSAAPSTATKAAAVITEQPGRPNHKAQEAPPAKPNGKPRPERAYITCEGVDMPVENLITRRLPDGYALIRYTAISGNGFEEFDFYIPIHWIEEGFCVSLEDTP